ncbi:ABC transporter ATP-binding protein [Gracilibacillus timonensis]|uniref:ABC transporter ATP-binding protein n=1 Tax=Gracilibacillus timonensis TaxID=1816696 RepID=UPI00082709EF|nr:ABC transporter ATP-binding protein [Gracilibacillus timonensis]
MITFKDVSKQFPDGTVAVDSIDLTINQGEFFVLIGPSGCGKTTTLKMINRLIPISDGTLFINEQKISEYQLEELRWNIGYVLQQIALFPHMTIAENISIVPELKRWDSHEIKDRVDELLEMVGLEPDTYRNRKPNELSGGEQQRVGVVRALAADPDIILMDEPFSALDPISREKLQDDIIHLQQTIQKTIVFVTHDMQEALKLADRICLMNNGKIVQVGKPDQIIHQPANDFVKDFVGSAGKATVPFQLETFVEKTYSQDKTADDFQLNSTATLPETLAALSKHEQILVEKEGKIIGQVNRQMMIAHFSKHLEEGEASDA